MKLSRAILLPLFAVASLPLSAQTNSFPSSGDAVLDSASNQYIARYATGNNNYAGTFRWHGLQLGNNGANYIVAGRTAAGGQLQFVVNNSSDFPTINGITAMTIAANGNVGFGTTSPANNMEIGVGGVSNSNAATWGLSITGDATGNAGFLGTRYVLQNSTANYAGFVRAVRTSGTTFIGLEIGSETNHGIRFLTNGASDAAERMRIDNSGNVGIGTTSPSVKLVVSGDGSNTEQFRVERGSGNLARLSFTHYSIQRVNGDGSYGSIVLNESGGNVGIGTTNPTQKLSVNGTIRAKEVIVDTGWSDYVFKPDYKLASLSEVEAHIKAHGHLPGVPSEAQVAKEGVSMGEMQSKLLAKIEELTLHLIRIEKENHALAEQNHALAARVQSLETR